MFQKILYLNFVTFVYANMLLGLTTNFMLVQILLGTVLVSFWSKVSFCGRGYSS